MENESTDKSDTTGEKTDNNATLFQQATALREEIAKASERLEQANAEARNIQATNLLSGTAGGHIATKTAEEQKADAVKKMADEMTNAFK